MMDLHIQVDNDHGLEEAGFSAFWKVLEGDRMICVCNEKQDAELILLLLKKERNNEIL